MAENIYDPPLASGAAPPEPSGIARSMGVLSIIFGAITVLANLWAIATQSGGMRARLDPQHMRDLPEVKAVQQATMPYVMTTTTIMIVMSIALIVIGVGLVKQRAIARRAAVIWSLVGLGVLGLRAWVWETRIWPKMEPMMRAVMDRAMEREMAKGGGQKPPFDVAALGSAAAHSTEFVSIAILAIYAILLLLLMSMSSVKDRLR